MRRAKNELRNDLERRLSCGCRLVEEFPDIKPLLARVNIDDMMSPEFGAHALRVVTGLDLCINALQDTPVLERVTSHLAVQHEGRVGVTKKYFDVRNFPFYVALEIYIANKL